MNSIFVRPNPILDKKELELIPTLSDYYIKFTKPKKSLKGIKLGLKAIENVAPEKVVQFTKESFSTAVESEIVKNAMQHASEGFSILQEKAVAFTLSSNHIVKVIRKADLPINNFDEICTLRSYKVEGVIQNRNISELLMAFTQGSATGLFGLPGVPFGIALSSFLYFRAVQSTAMYYGYDVKSDPRELEFASNVTAACLFSHKDNNEREVPDIIGKIMHAADFDSLRASFSGGERIDNSKAHQVEFLYEKIRELAAESLKKALEKSSDKGLESSIFQKLLQHLGGKITKEVGKKALPVLGALIGGLSDTYFMNRVLEGSNLIYHKRFIFEKEKRISLLEENL